MHARFLLITFSSQSQSVKNYSQATPVEEGGEVEEDGEEERPDSMASKTDPREPKLTNQFNFSERASQTLNNPLRVGKRITSFLFEERCL